MRLSKIWNEPLNKNLKKKIEILWLHTRFTLSTKKHLKKVFLKKCSKMLQSIRDEIKNVI